MLDWQSKSEDFEHAPDDDIRTVFEIAGVSGRVRRVSEQFLAKKCIRREFANQVFAWKTLNTRGLRVPKPIRYVSGSFDSENGIMVMEFLDGCSWDTAETVDESRTNEFVYKAVQHMHNAPLDTMDQQILPGPLDGGLAESFPWGRGQKEAECPFTSLQDVETCANRRLARHAKRTKQRNARSINLQGQRLAICHGDLAPSNILILADEQVALLDWEWMCIYPAIVDLACLSMLEIERPHEKQKLLIEALKSAACCERARVDIEEDMRTLRIVDRESLRYSF